MRKGGRQAGGGGLDAGAGGEDLLDRGGAEAVAGAEEEEVGQDCAPASAEATRRRADSTRS